MSSNARTRSAIPPSDSSAAAIVVVAVCLRYLVRQAWPVYLLVGWRFVVGLFVCTAVDLYTFDALVKFFVNFPQDVQ